MNFGGRVEGYTLDGSVLCADCGEPYDNGEDDGAKPLLSHDEFGLGTCDVCHAPVDCSWGPQHVDEATEMLRFGIDDIKEHGTIDGARFEYQQHLAEHLGWCNKSTYDERVLGLWHAYAHGPKTPAGKG